MYSNPEIHCFAMAKISYFKLLLSGFYGSVSIIIRSKLSSIRMGSGDLAKYPFLSEAGEYLRDSAFGWDELERPDMKYIIDRAIERIEIAVDGKVYDKLERYENEILTFLISII